MDKSRETPTDTKWERGRCGQRENGGGGFQHRECNREKVGGETPMWRDRQRQREGQRETGEWTQRKTEMCLIPEKHRAQSHTQPKGERQTDDRQTGKKKIGFPGPADPGPQTEQSKQRAKEGEKQTNLKGENRDTPRHSVERRWGRVSLGVRSGPPPS